MGQGKSQLNNAPLYNPAEFDIAPKRNDSRYGNILPLTHKASRAELVVVTKTLQEEEDLIKRLAELDIREKLHHPNLVQLLKKNSKKQDDFCSTFYELGLLYEYWTGNLKNEVAERRNVGVGYQEGELWYLAESLLSVVHYLKSEGLTHSDIRPYNVMLTQQGTVKLGEVFMHTRSISAFSQLLNHQLDEYYISPQQFQRLRSVREAVNKDYDVNKSEIYSVGVTLLEAATLEDVSNLCYDKENYVINTVSLNRLLEIVQQHYSYQFASFLSKLLRENENERSSVEELLGELQQPSIAQQKYTSITLIDLLKLNIPDNQDAIHNQPEQYEEIVVRSAPPAAVIQQEAPVPAQNPAEMDDLNARIQAVLAMSRDTIARYGVSTGVPSPSPVTYTSTQVYNSNPIYTIPPEVKASHIETRTFLNENTNTIETRVYPPQPSYNDQIEEVIKRSQKPQEVPQPEQNTNATYQQQYEPVQYTQNVANPITAPITTTTYSQPQQVESVYTVPSQTYQQTYTTSYATGAPSNQYANTYTDYTAPSQIQNQSYTTSTYTSAPVEQNSYLNKIDNLLAEQKQAPTYSNSTYNFAPSSVGGNGPVVTSYSTTTTSYVPQVATTVTETKPLDARTKQEQDDYIQKLIEGMKLKNSEQANGQPTYQSYTTSSYVNN